MNLSAIPHSPGVYLMRDRTGAILYIGKAKDLFKRVSSYFMDRETHTLQVRAMVASVSHVDYIPAASEREALVMEQSLVHQLKPPYNVMLRDDKSYPFIKLTWNEDFPRLFLTRTVKRDGGKYFGPYPNVGHVRHLLRYLWKQKLFPLRPCHYEFSDAKPLPLKVAKQCLYYHTKECPAPCVNRISKTDYREIASNAKTFFSGDFRRLVKVWQKEMEEASEKMDYEKAAQLRDNLAALTHMEERVTVREVKLDDLHRRVGRSRAVTDLQKALDLKKPPLRIECFDISHSQGQETVASLVVFERGLPKKQDYRKFKIRTVRGIDDFASMAEVVGRRYRRLQAERAPLPDLILIDGGKGQLSAARAVLKTEKDLARVPIAALAKQEEELFVPGREDSSATHSGGRAPVVWRSIRLPADSPALHLVQFVRNEAHRFAITFHRQRRARQFLQKK